MSTYRVVSKFVRRPVRVGYREFHACTALFNEGGKSKEPASAAGCKDMGDICGNGKTREQRNSENKEKKTKKEKKKKNERRARPSCRPIVRPLSTQPRQIRFNVNFFLRPRLGAEFGDVGRISIMAGDTGEYIYALLTLVILDWLP